MNEFQKCELFSTRFERLNDAGKQYIDAILQALEFAQLETKNAAQGVPTPPHLPSSPAENRTA